MKLWKLAHGELIEQIYFQGEPDERTALLIEQHRRNINNIVPPPHLEDDMNEYASSLPKRDEQTALNRIVQETNS